MRGRWGWFASLLIFLLMGLFIHLGLWQLERAEEKARLLQLQTERQADGIHVLDGSEQDAELMRFQTVEVVGEMVAAAQFLLDNRKHLKQAGYHVLVPVAIQGSDHAVLVNRGWIAQGVSRAELPVVEVQPGTVRLQGTVRVPTVHGYRLDQDPTAPLRLYIDLPAISSAIGRPLLPFVVRAESTERAPLNDALIRQWPAGRGALEPSMHRGYAMQWFAFALVLLGGWIALWMRSRTKMESGEA